ncbi:dihydrofolate reductase [Novipirellula artificiosorum]|uniref:Dihydrofolate reductase n=1 Tax=Novipirellula artificiosorum TaxID=2528016 RepID=A0A5C6DAP4_9BACT|nr:dihydrofolate reductase [Novipirellula artificiosorum]TWU34243.1 Dihydrofolate reductase type 3 [Novipirellula artificiosorum]
MSGPADSSVPSPPSGQDQQGSGCRAHPLVALVAMTPSGVIGKDGDMPWRLSSDLQRFKRMTMGGTLIMGRKTFDSIGRPLPGRRTIVITRNADWTVAGVTRAASPEQAVALAGDAKPAFVVGGAEIYRQLIPFCGEVWLTRVWSSVSGDTILTIDLSQFEQIEHTRLPASAKDDVPTEFSKLRRKISGKNATRPH